MKVRIEWWRLFDVKDNMLVARYNYHVVSVGNNKNILHTTQGYSKKVDMFYITENLFPGAETKQIEDRYTRKYIRDVLKK